MAIAPITGTLRKKIAMDISVGIVMGTAFGSLWWWGFHKKKIDAREAFYTKMAQEKADE
ncbi:Cytochrome c oxidase subunit 7A [Hanseniaspora vineae]